LRANSSRLDDKSITSINSLPKLAKGGTRSQFVLTEPLPYISFAMYNGAQDSTRLVRVYTSRDLQEQLLENAKQFCASRIHIVTAPKKVCFALTA
jgi:hypothetical protein